MKSNEQLRTDRMKELEVFNASTRAVDDVRNSYLLLVDMGGDFIVEFSDADFWEVESMMGEYQDDYECHIVAVDEINEDNARNALSKFTLHIHNL